MANFDYMLRISSDCFDGFGAIQTLIDLVRANELESGHALRLAINTISQLGYSGGLLNAVNRAAENSVIEIANNDNFMSELLPWRYNDIDYIEGKANTVRSIVLGNLTSALAFNNVDLSVKIETFNEPRDARTGNIRNAQYRRISLRDLDNSDDKGVRLKGLIRLNRNPSSAILHPYKWLAGIFHECVHVIEDVMAHAYNSDELALTDISPSIQSYDFRLSSRRSEIVIDKEFYRIAYPIYELLPSEKLARAGQKVFMDELHEQLLKRTL